MKTVEFQSIVIRRNRECIEGYCTASVATVRKSQYGTDDECPECGEELDWEVRNE